MYRLKYGPHLAYNLSGRMHGPDIFNSHDQAKNLQHNL